MAKEIIDNPKLVILKSSSDHPMNIPYNGGTIVMPPYGKTKKINKKLLGALPKGVHCINV